MNILILTGAGISAESGIPTFRGSDGLWEGHRVEDVATPEAFVRDPDLVWRFYNGRRRKLLQSDVHPNAAHHSLVRLERWHRSRYPDDSFLLVTQNIDDLHQRAGSENLLPMHGELLAARDMDDGEIFRWTGDFDRHTPHPEAPDDDTRRGRLRPHVVWFGEMPIGLNRIDQAARSADVFLSIGTSGVVYPAAGIVETTPADCQRIEFNLDDTPTSSHFDTTLRGPSSETLPNWVQSFVEQRDGSVGEAYRAD